MTKYVAGSNHFIFSGPHTRIYINAHVCRHTYSTHANIKPPCQRVHAHKYNMPTSTGRSMKKCASIHNANMHASAQTKVCLHAYVQVNTLMHTFCNLHTFSAFQMRQTTGEI